MNRVQLVMAGALLALGAPGRAAEPAASAPTSAVSAEPAAVPPGKVLFDRHCAFCHAAGAGNAGTMRLTEVRGAAKAVLEERTDLDPAYIKVVVRQGLVEMPPYRQTEIDNTQLEQLVRYLVRNN
jgi:mono/diheme cytochrome c family protein